jgi:uracil-DNA glycosylase
MTGKPSGREDAFWNTLSSFGIEEVFALPGWVEGLREVRGASPSPGRESEAAPVLFRPGHPGTAPAGIREGMTALRGRVGDCMACRLAAGRTRLVFGTGNPASGIVLVGEGPGANEDQTGEPFVGRAGQLLDRIMSSIGLDRTNSYITNIVKCRPPENRTPAPDESAACWWILEEQIRIMAPGVIVALGAPAARTLTGSREGIGKLRGVVHRYGDIPVLATYHPAALLRTDALKRPVWEDMKMLRELLGELGLPRTER